MVLLLSKPEAQFPSAVPPDDEQVSDDWQVPYITFEEVAVDRMVHWLKCKVKLSFCFKMEAA
jgi:hypothetical protein